MTQEQTEPYWEEVREDVPEPYAFEADRDDMAELNEFPEEIDETDEEALARRQALAAVPETALLPATEENIANVMARLEQAGVGVEVAPEQMPPGSQPGASGIGAGEGKRVRSPRKRKGHGRR